jgi:rubrerythrin
MLQQGRMMDCRLAKSIAYAKCAGREGLPVSKRERTEVYRAKDGQQAHVLQAALQNAGIEAVIEGEFLEAALGELPIGWSVAPRIMVESRHIAKARELIANWESATASAAPRSRESDDLDACLACGTRMTPADAKCPACGWSYKQD